MFNMESALEEFEVQYKRKIAYNVEDDMFYEEVEGKLQPIRIGQDKEDRVEREPVSFGLVSESHGSYGIRLSEADQKLADIISSHVDRVVGKELEERGLMEERNDEYHSLGTGVCHIFWARKKEILKQKYGIEWQSPKDLDPTTFYD